MIKFNNYDAEKSGPYRIKVIINEVQININSIESFLIKQWLFDVMPRIEMTFTDSFVFGQSAVPYKGSKIGISIFENSDANISTTQWSIMDHKVKFKDGKSIVTVTGILDIEGIFNEEFRAYSSLNSSTMLKQFMNTLGVKYDSKLFTDDSMNWLQTGESNLEFLNDVKDKLNINNDVGFINFDYDNGTEEFSPKFTLKSIQDSIISKENFAFVQDKDGATSYVDESFDLYDLDTKYNLPYLSLNHVDFSGITSMLSNADNDILGLNYLNGFDNMNYVEKLSKTTAIRKRVIARNVHENYESIIGNSELYPGLFSNFVMINTQVSKNLSLLSPCKVVVRPRSESVYSVLDGDYLVVAKMLYYDKLGLSQRACLGRNKYKEDIKDGIIE